MSKIIETTVEQEYLVFLFYKRKGQLVPVLKLSLDINGINELFDSYGKLLTENQQLLLDQGQTITVTRSAHTYTIQPIVA